MSWLCRMHLHAAVEVRTSAGARQIYRCLLCGRTKPPKAFGIAVIKIPLAACRNLSRYERVE